MKTSRGISLRHDEVEIRFLILLRYLGIISEKTYEKIELDVIIDMQELRARQYLSWETPPIEWFDQ